MKLHVAKYLTMFVFARGLCLFSGKDSPPKYVHLTLCVSVVVGTNTYLVLGVIAEYHTKFRLLEVTNTKK